MRIAYTAYAVDQNCPSTPRMLEVDETDLPKEMKHLWYLAVNDGAGPGEFRQIKRISIEEDYGDLRIEGDDDSTLVYLTFWDNTNPHVAAYLNHIKLER